MYSNVDIPKRLRVAVILLVALLLLSVQQNALRQFVSSSDEQLVTVEGQLSFQQGNEGAGSLGIVHHDSHFVLAACLAFALLLLLFPVVLGIRFTATAPAILSRNSCCIVPKGP